MFGRKCPNEKTIRSRNGIVDALTYGIENPEPFNPEPIELTSIFEDLIIEESVKTAGSLACRRCIGLIVDLSKGTLYCGREVPQQVIDSNQRIEES